MEFTLVQDLPKRRLAVSHRTLVATALALTCVLIGAGVDYSLHCIFSSRPSSPRPTFLLVGDSLTQYGSSVNNSGWAAQLQDKYVRSADVINRGIGGKTTRTTIEDVLPGLCDELSGWLQPSLITVWLGANDASDPAGSNGNASVPLNEYRQNLAFIVRDLLWLAPNAKILLLTPPTVDEDTRRAIQVQDGESPTAPLDRTNERTGTYAAAAKTVGDAYKRVTTIDVYTHFMTTYPNTTERAKLLVDGLHFTAAGNSEVFQLVDEQIQRMWSEFAHA